MKISASFGLDPLNSDGTGLTRGFEVSIQKKLTDTPYYGILSLTYSEANFTALDDVERIGSYDQTWIFNISGGYKFSEEWETSLKFRYSTGKPYTPYNSDGTQNVDDINSLRFTDKSIVLMLELIKDGSLRMDFNNLCRYSEYL